MIFILIVKRAIKTHEHVNEDFALSIPHTKVLCFWRRLFEILDYVHSRRIQWMDPRFWNILLQNGEIILFDWHLGEYIEPDPEDGITKGKKLLLGHKFLEEEIHVFDVRKISKRIGNYLDTLGNTTGWDEDTQRLNKMRKRMSSHTPPSFHWLLQNDDYFTRHSLKDDLCSLVW